MSLCMERWSRAERVVRLLLLASAGCGGGARVSSAPRVTTDQKPPTPLAEDEGDYLQDAAEVFRSWDELPRAEQSQIHAALFRTHIVIRLRVQLGCVTADLSKRPKSGYLWGAFAQQCITGSGRTHPLHAVDTDSILETNTWALPSDSSLQPVMHVEVTKEGTAIGLAPPVVWPCETTIVDTHWLAVPKGRVSVSRSEGSDHCANGGDRDAAGPPLR